MTEAGGEEDAGAFAQGAQVRGAESDDDEVATARLGTVVDRYTIVRLLGRGGMGVVYEARHTKLARRCALKFLLPRVAANADVLRRFENEARAAGGLEHPNLAAVTDAGRDGHGAPYLVMEYLEGEDCGRLLSRAGRLDPARAANIVAQACRGLSVAHRAGIVHRDLKPANLFLTDAGDGSDLVKVLDFGIAKLRLSSEATVATGTGETFGTAHYMSPEQARAAAEVDARTDVWSLGVVLYEMLTGRRPFEDGPFLHVVYQILGTAPPAPRTLRPELPADLAAIVERAMAKDIERRFQSVTALGEALAAFTGQARAVASSQRSAGIAVTVTPAALEAVPATALTPATGLRTGGTGVPPAWTGPPAPSFRASVPPSVTRAGRDFEPPPPSGRQRGTGRRWPFVVVALIAAGGVAGVASRMARTRGSHDQAGAAPAAAAPRPPALPAATVGAPVPGPPAPPAASRAPLPGADEPAAARTKTNEETGTRPSAEVRSPPRFARVRRFPTAPRRPRPPRRFGVFERRPNIANTPPPSDGPGLPGRQSPRSPRARPAIPRRSGRPPPPSIRSTSTRPALTPADRLAWPVLNTMREPISSRPIDPGAGNRGDQLSFMSSSMSSSITFLLALLAAAAVLVAAPAARAQTDPKATADEHFKKGVAAFKERRFGDAAVEFQEAYRLSPAYAVLYNIGEVNAALGRSVEAVDAFERFLKEGASAVPPDRVRQVQAEIAKQADRIGTVAVQTTPEGADIRMDGRLLGRTPLLQPVRATIGPHAFDAFLKGYLPQVHEVDVVGRAERPLSLALEAGSAPAAAEPANAAPASGAAPPAPAPVRPVVTVPEIPRPDPSSPASKVPPSSLAASPATNWQRVIGYVVAIGGLATATAGGLMAYDGANKMNDANGRLATAMTAAQYDMLKPSYDADYAAAKHRNHLGWTIAGIGAAALIGGIFIVATAPDRTSNANVALTLTPILASAGPGLSLGGAW